jgi:hypothetical protein
MRQSQPAVYSLTSVPVPQSASDPVVRITHHALPTYINVYTANTYEDQSKYTALISED